MHHSEAIPVSARVPCGPLDPEVPTGMSEWAWNDDKQIWELIGCNCQGKWTVPPPVVGRKGEVRYQECFECTESETGVTAESAAAVAAMRAKVADQLPGGAVLIRQPAPAPPSPIPVVPLAENPLFDDWLAAVEDYRNARDAEERAAEAG